MQTYIAEVTPFLVHRLGSAATVQAGYSFQYSSQNLANTFQYSSQNLANIAQTNAESVAANFTAHRGFAVVRSGEDFGRLALQARVDGTKYVGSGIYDDAHNF